MAYVKNSNVTAPRNGFSKPTGGQKLTAEKISPTHTFSVRCGEGDNVEFISLTGLFPGQTKDGRSMMKGKPNKVKILLQLEDGRELIADQFFVNAKS